jgi:hypothetical protein
MPKQMSLDLGRQFQPVRTHTSGPYTATYRQGDKTAAVTHKSDPNDVLDNIPVGRAPKKALQDWHDRTRLEYR